MAKAITEVAIGAAAIGAAVLLPGAGIAAAAAILHVSSAAIVGTLVSIGASTVLSGIADALRNNQGGLAVAVTTPVGPWGYVYGTQKVGGVEVFRQSNNNTGIAGSTSNDKQLHRVYVLACHPCAIGGGWQLRIDGREVLLRLSSTPGYYESYSPTQIHQTIASISRDVNGLVAMTLAVGMSGLDGTEIQITECPDNSFNGIWIVTQPNPADNTLFNFICGGPVRTVSGGQCWTLYSDYKDKIGVQFLNGTHTQTFSVLAKAGTSWNANDKLLGRTAVYVQMGYDDTVFPSAIPNVSFIIDGKNDILDPRTGTRGFTKNAALIVADFLSLPPAKGGFGLTIGSTIPTAQLSAAANICDENVPLAAGGTVKRYTCNTFFQLNMARGAILSDLLSSCAGRISYQGGTYNIFPGAWVGATLHLGPGDLIGPIKLAPRHSIRDTCNAVKGTYVSPENNFQMADVPPFMCDYKHDYGLITDPGQGDQYLLEDNGERVFREANFPCTDNAATAQRLEKIALLRTRFQHRATIRCSMKAYQCVALDIIQLTHPRYGWADKNFEVLASRLVLDKSQSNAPTLAVELDLAETNSIIYDWATTEELTPQGFKQPTNVGAQVCQPPEFVTLYSGPGGVVGGITYPSTVTTRSDGTVTNSLLVEWTTPNDAYVTSGGHLEIQWSTAGVVLGLLIHGPWVSAGKFDPSVNQAFLTPVSDGQQYLVQIRAVNCVGVPSQWIEVGPETVTSTYSTVSYSGVALSQGSLSAQALVGGTAQITVTPFTPPWGATVTASPAVLTGLNQSQLYHVYYIDLGFAGGTVTAIATQNPADYENRAGYFLIGSIVTPNYSTRYQPSSFSDVGSDTTSNPAAAYDNDVTTDAVVVCSWGSIVTGFDAFHNPIYGTYQTNGHCFWGGLPAVTTPAITTLNVIASADFGGIGGGSASGAIVIVIGGVNHALAAFTATTAEATYTLSIPAGTDLSTISISAQMSMTAGTPPGGGAAVLQGFEIWIQ